MFFKIFHNICSGVVKTDFRTDLAIEKKEDLSAGELPGVKSEQSVSGDARITRITVLDRRGAESLGKPEGRYITVEIPPMTERSPVGDGLIETVARELSSILPPDGPVLVAGLGNSDITPDAVGPMSAELVLATRHIGRELAESVGLGGLRPVCVFIPGVLGKTGVETAELLRGVIDSVSPVAVIAVDALAARRVSRLGNTVQLSDTGVIPGSGVGNARAAINTETVGVPVISVGVPTVVDAGTLICDLTGEEHILDKRSGEMIITPREIDLLVQRAAALIGLSIDKALQPQLSTGEIMMLVGNG